MAYLINLYSHLNNITMLEHQKKVLQGVGNDKYLFKKELLKSLGWLNENEIKLLTQWVKEQFTHMHADVLMDVLYPKFNYAS